MIKRISLGLLIVALSTSCVSKKIYTDLENKYADLKKENRSLSDENADLLKSKNQLELDRDGLNKELAKIKSAVKAAYEIKFFVAAGHGLDYENVLPIAAIKEIHELNIGHSIISRAVFVGLPGAVKEMLALIGG